MVATDSNTVRRDLTEYSDTEQELVVIPGVRKSGTTTLFDLLAGQSRLSPCMYKEPQFFACDEATVVRNLNWYRGLFTRASAGDVWLDGSTWYFASPHTPLLIKKLFPRAKAILCVRDPVDRAYSGYNHNRKGVAPLERRSFDSIVSQMSDLVDSGMNLIDAEDRMLSEAVSQSLIDTDHVNRGFHRNKFGCDFDTNVYDPLMMYRYFSESRYDLWINSWRDSFDRDLLVISFDDLTQNPQQVLSRISRFLNLNLDVEISLAPQSNQTFLYKKKWQREFLQKVERASKVRLLKTFLPTRLIKRFLNYFKKKASATPDSISESLRDKAEKVLARE